MRPLKPLTEAELAAAAIPRDMGGDIRFSYAPEYLAQVTGRRTPEQQAEWLKELVERVNKGRSGKDLIPVAIIALHLDRNFQCENLQAALGKEFQKTAVGNREANFSEALTKGNLELAGLEHRMLHDKTFTGISTAVFKKIASPESRYAVFRDFQSESFLKDLEESGIKQDKVRQL